MQAGRPESEIRIYNISSTWHRFEGSHWSHRKYQRVHMNNSGKSVAFLPVKFRLLNDEFGSCRLKLHEPNSNLRSVNLHKTLSALHYWANSPGERANLAIWALVQAEHADWKSQDWTTHLLMSRWSALTLTPQKVSNEECQEECLEFIQVMWLKHKCCLYTLIPELTVKKWRKEVFEYFLKIAHTHNLILRMKVRWDFLIRVGDHVGNKNFIFRSLTGFLIKE